MALLTLEKQKKVDSLVGPMIQMINADLAVTDSERMLSIFFEAFQEMLIAPCGLQFGQLSFIGRIFSYVPLFFFCLLKETDSLCCFLVSPKPDLFLR